jgi:flagellar capping protein FliD
MGTLNFPGLATGIDTGTIIKQLMAVEGRRLATYQVAQKTSQDKTTALNDLRTKVDSLKSAASALSNAQNLETFTTTSSDSDKLSIIASSSANAGSHTIRIKQLASSETWLQQTSTFENTTDYVGAGQFIYSYNHKEIIIQTEANKTTLDDLVNLINKDDDNPGVTASFMNEGGKYHLMLSGNETGTDYQISINAANTEVWQTSSAFTKSGTNAALTNKLTELSQFSGSLAGGEHITISGHKHDGTAVSQDFTITANTTLNQLIEKISEVFGDATASLVDGKITLTDNTCGTSQMDLTLEYDPAAGPTAFAPLATARNTEGGTKSANITSLAPVTFLKSQSAQDAMIKVDGYPPGADDWISKNSNNINDVLTGITLSLQDITPDDTSVKITLARNTGAVKTKIQNMLKAYNDLKSFLADKTEYNADTKKMGILSDDTSVSFVKELIYNPFVGLTSGFTAQNDSLVQPSDIGITFDGKGLMQFDSAKFDDAVKTNFDAVINLIGAIDTGNSSSNVVKFYSSSDKYTTSGTYDLKVEVAQIDGVKRIISAKIKLSTESEYRNATWSGSMITGSSASDKNGKSVNPENGLQLSVDLNNVGVYGTDENPIIVHVKKGFAGTLEDNVNNILNTGGTISLSTKALEDTQKRLQSSIDREQTRLDNVQKRLTEKYARLEKTLSQLQQQMASVTQLSSMISG